MHRLLLDFTLDFTVQNGDLYRLDPSAKIWLQLELAGNSPLPIRENFAFATAPDGRFYLFGGWSNGGELRAELHDQPLLICARVPCTHG